MKNFLSNIKKSKYYLDKNECIAIPTETVYGLAGNAYSEKATSKIFRLKNRSKNNPLIVHYYNLRSLKKDCKINKVFLKLYKRFCPGPITFVLKLNKKRKVLRAKKLTTFNKKNLNNWMNLTKRERYNLSKQDYVNYMDRRKLLLDEIRNEYKKISKENYEGNIKKK